MGFGVSSMYGGALTAYLKWIFCFNVILPNSLCGFDCLVLL